MSRTSLEEMRNALFIQIDEIEVRLTSASDKEKVFSEMADTINSYLCDPKGKCAALRDDLWQAECEKIRAKLANFKPSTRGPILRLMIEYRDKAKRVPSRVPRVIGAAASLAVAHRSAAPSVAGGAFAAASATVGRRRTGTSDTASLAPVDSLTAAPVAAAAPPPAKELIAPSTDNLLTSSTRVQDLLKSLNQPNCFSWMFKARREAKKDFLSSLNTLLITKKGDELISAVRTLIDENKLKPQLYSLIIAGIHSRVRRLIEDVETKLNNLRK